MRILVVNHIATIEPNIGNILDDHQVFLERNYENVKNVIGSQNIQLVVIDLDNNSLEGFNLIKTLRSSKEYKNLPIIIFTRKENLGDEKKGLELGADDYIRKPFHYATLRIRMDMYNRLIRLEKIKLELKRQNTFFNTIFKQTSIGMGVFQYQEEGILSFMRLNDKFKEILGRSYKEMFDEGWQKFTHPDDLEENLDKFKRLHSGEINNYIMEKRYIKPDGSIVWVLLIVSRFRLTEDNKLGYICLIQDITKEKLSEAVLLESERSKKIFLSQLPGLAYRSKYDRDWTMEYISSGCLDLTGYSQDALLYNRDLSFNDIIAPEYRELLWKEWEYILNHNLPFRYEYEIITAEGERKWVYETGQGVFDKYGKVVALEGVILDISDRKEIEDNLMYISIHDSLTGLHNRSYFESVLKKEIDGDSNKKALVGINLNSLQVLTLSYGFYYVQDLIKKIAHSLELYISKNHLLFRSYETRFVFYIKNYQDLEELIKFSEVIRDVLEPIISMERIIGGIGIYEIKGNDSHIADILKKLLIASEKAMLGNLSRSLGISSYDEEIEKKIMREDNIRRELYNIIENQPGSKLVLEFQPILDLKTNKISSFEALARIDSDKLGRIPPLEFIPIAEKTKLIIPIGERIFRYSLEFLKNINNNLGYREIKVSINISAIQLMEKDFVKNTLKIIEEMKVAHKNIILEITESTFATNYEEINIIIDKLRRFGLLIAIDDFGVGYSSLARVSELNVDYIKIDKFFINKLLEVGPESSRISDIISMSHKLGQKVIAEGVEYDSQKEYLIECGCNNMQGFLISKPSGKEEAINLLIKYNKTIL